MKRALAAGQRLNYLNSPSIIWLLINCYSCKFGWIQVIEHALIWSYQGYMERLCGDDIINMDDALIGTSQPCPCMLPGLPGTALMPCWVTRPFFWLEGPCQWDQMRPVSMHGSPANHNELKKNHQFCLKIYMVGHSGAFSWVGWWPVCWPDAMADPKPWMSTPKRMNPQRVALLKEWPRSDVTTMFGIKP